MTDWLNTLRAEVDRSSQGAAGARIGYSGTTVSRVLNGTYSGDIDRVEQAVRGALMGETVDCPIAGDIPRHRCLAHQRAPFAATNPMRVQLWHACRGGCIHSRLEDHT